jgi:hypothetical protein
LFGKDYTIVQARRNGAKNSQIKILLMGGAVRDTLNIGQTKTYTIDGSDFEVTADFVDSNSAKFTVNGQGTRDMLDGDTDKLSDGTVIGVSEILYQDYAGGVQNVEFFLGAQKVELKDTNINDTVSSNSLKIDDDTIDDAFVIVEGTDDDSTFKITRLHINMTADDDLYVPAGGKLSENPDLDEPEVIFTQNWDIEYKGLVDQPVEEIKLSTSGNKRYKLEFLDGDGNKVSLPLVEAVAASVLEFGEKGKALINAENKTIKKDNYVILTDSTENRGERKTYVLQYKGADKISADSPVVKFKNLGSGKTIEQTYSTATSLDGVATVGGKLATLKIGGTDYNVYNHTSIKSNDFDITIDLDGDASLEAPSPGIANYSNQINITTYHGMEIGIQNGTTLTSNGVVVSFKTPDNTREGGNTLDNVETIQATDYVINVSADTNTKVALAVLTGFTKGQDGTALSERTPTGESNIQYAYSSYGTFITRESPSSEPGTVKIEYPKEQRSAQVYISAKGTTFSSAVAADGDAVTIQRIDVGATKLASEVGDVNAMNSILVGGPCANAKAAEVLGNPADCTAGFEPGKGKVELYDVGTGNVAMLVAGYSAADTRNAANVVANYKDFAGKLKGDKVEVTKVSNQLTVAEPSKVMEEVMDETVTPAADGSTDTTTTT